MIAIEIISITQTLLDIIRFENVAIEWFTFEIIK